MFEKTIVYDNQQLRPLIIMKQMIMVKFIDYPEREYYNYLWEMEEIS